MLQQNYLWNKKGIYPESCDEVVQGVRQRWYDVHPQLLWDSCEDKRTKVGRSDANFDRPINCSGLSLQNKA